MKRFLLIVCALCLLVTACRREYVQPSIGEMGDALMGAIANRERFTVADEDYTDNNFNIADETEEARVYMDEGREIGIFYLERDGNMQKAEQGIKAYLEGERSALASLSALYPSKELTEKLQRYQNATILKRGRYICYFILNETEMTAAQMAFGNALR